ncbi:MAG: methylated-DNA--[protein]-cysteine S-methyltransferase [Anaerolineales bacterium]|nr:methylated-DNA--[protein]-cysteine S-methyltransferase [Anaerolineales bacterium]MCB8937539.1 methylated-DNA--[protein]-cysteine S-methyltransferase [Ardenticatenaceae bacterium]
MVAKLAHAELSVAELSADYGRIEAAILYLEQNFQTQPTLADVAAHVGLSEYHFQRLFSRWAGTSPKRFLQFLTIQHSKKLLADSQTILDATYEAGLSSPSRLHDLFVTHEAITPGEFKQKGAGLTIQYGFHTSPFGNCLIALTERGICGLQFVADGDRAATLAELKASWPQAEFVEDNGATRPFINPIFNLSEGEERPSLPLYLKGTNFQIQVWQALLKIPVGTAVSYGTVAQLIGNPKASRAVGSATGSNPIGYLIPCHRVIRQAGNLGDYRWGSSRKKAILGWEAAHFR